MENQKSETKKIEVVYDKAPLSKRVLSHFFDISIWLLTSLIFFTVINSIVNNSGWYKSKENQLITLRNDSKLYKDNKVVTKYIDDSNEFTSIQEKKEFLVTCINEFYANPDFFTDTKHLTEYSERKLKATTEGVHLFIEKEGQVVENEVQPAYLLDFYKTEIDDHSLGYLFYNSKYFDLTRFDFWKVMVEIISSATFFYLIYYLLLPLTLFKRGRSTIGMKLSKIGLLDIHALTPKKLSFVLRTLFNLLVFVYLNVVAFLIPSFISIGMMFLTKTNQSLTNYIFNDYFVDTSNQHIYLDEGERQFSKSNLEKVSIENKDFIIK